MAVQVSMISVGATSITAGFSNISRGMQVRLTKLVRHHGQLLRTRVMANASGRPGPNTPTGDYRRSISLQIVSTADTTTAYVGTNLPQGRRLEFGFHGQDSLGRTYNQAPLPHFGPAFDQQEPEFTRAAEVMLGTALT
jgi:hypothetical protein